MIQSQAVLFDPRIHPATLTDQDLETLQLFGVRAVVAVGNTPDPGPSSPRALFSQFDELLGTQLPRLERAGLKAWAALGVHPAAIPRRGLGQVLEALPGYFKAGKVIALGQLGLGKGDEREEEALLEQLALARRFHRAAIVSAPGLDGERLARKLLSALRRSKLAPERILVDGAVVRTVRTIRELGYVAGLTLHPERLSVEQAVKLVRTLGPERLVLETAAGDGASDIVALARAAHRLSKARLSSRVIRRVTFENALALFELPWEE